MNIEHVKLSQIHINANNPRTITDEKFGKLIDSILVLPKMLELRPIVVDDTFTALGGNMRFRALTAIEGMSVDELAQRFAGLHDYTKKTQAERDSLIVFWDGWKTNPVAPVIKASELSEDERREFIIKDNVGFGDWDMDALANEWDSEDLDAWGVDVWQPNGWDEAGNADSVEGGIETNPPSGVSLNDRFIVPPFSILDTRKGYWQARKKMWREQIGDMGESRNDTLLHSLEVKYKDLYMRTTKHRKELGVSFKEYLDKYVPKDVLEKEGNNIISNGVSLFDPVLSETMVKWFTPNDGCNIFDCFAGDTYKGLVFAMCGHKFKGIELRQEQVDINNRIISGRELEITYVCDDGRNVAQHIAPESQDLLFSCPPYYDLEVYSNIENDASNQETYEDFVGILHDAFTAAIGCLKDNRFAVIVVGDVRNKRTGCYYDFCGDIKRIFKEGGMSLYNEMILVETAASTAMRAARYMESRKVAKTHQNVLVFYKGDTNDIKKHFPKIEYSSEEESFIEDASNEGREEDGDKLMN